MSITLKNKAHCSGCTACQQICPENSIAMVEDNEGFLYPHVDSKTCIECGLCEKVCPVFKEKPQEEMPKEGWILQNKDEKVLEKSTSGGALTLVAQEILKDKGFVYGCAFDEKFDAVHVRITDSSDLWKLRGSKYVQSFLDDSFGKIKADLKADRKVLFIGTPCQVEGLISFLRKPYENLFTVDFVCRGVPSPMIWRKHREYLSDKYKSKINYASFREKTYGYNSGSIVVGFENGKKSIENTLTDYMEKSFFDGLISRPICYECPFKTLKRKSDLTVFDGWHYGELTGKADDNKGHTIALVQSDRGKEMIEKISPYTELINIDTEKALKLDGRIMTQCAPAHPKRQEYFEKINQGQPINKVVADINPVKTSRRIFGKMKRVLHKTGLLKLIKKRRWAHHPSR